MCVCKYCWNYCAKPSPLGGCMSGGDLRACLSGDPKDRIQCADFQPLAGTNCAMCRYYVSGGKCTQLSGLRYADPDSKACECFAPLEQLKKTKDILISDDRKLAEALVYEDFFTEQTSFTDQRLSYKVTIDKSGTSYGTRDDAIDRAVELLNETL